MMRYGAMTLQDDDQVMALCAGRPGKARRCGAVRRAEICQSDSRPEKE
ncbi:MAG: hypothetical protein IH900_05325 [Proteobacteria bacterium]|nr:hypothetical protein [Pseudomonadota bacterium]